MKKILTIVLFTLSPFTFAQEFNPDLLIGTWKCTGNSTGEHVKVHSVSYDTYNPNYSYESENIWYLEYPEFPNAKAIAKDKVKGQWRVQGSEMDSWRTQYLQFDINATNPVIQSMLEKRDFPHTNLYKVAVSNITVISKDSLVFELNKEYAQVTKGGSKQFCIRIK